MRKVPTRVGLALGTIVAATLFAGCGAPQPQGTAAGKGTLRAAARSAADFREESIYFAMTDRFVDGDPRNNNIFGDEYRPGQLTFNQGGDFKGLIDNLDHIKDMGFTALWITPPVMQPPGRYLNDSRSYEASGYHGYWAWDFSKVDPHLESPGATYDDLIRACHARGIKVVQDIVTNHGHGTATAPEVRWHADRNKVYGLGLGFDVGQDAQRWFNHGGPQIADLMDFNDNNPAVVDWFAKIYEAYQDRGVDAFRIDTMAWMAPKFWTAFADRMHANKPGFFMFGEVWTNGDFNWLASYTKLGSGDGAWPMERGVSVLDMPGSAMNTWGQLEYTFKGGDYAAVDNVLRHDPLYTDATYLVGYLDNHDKPRFNGTGGDGRPASTTEFIDALSWYFTARGIPCIYYGTEVQMEGGNDPDNRRVLGREGIAAAKSNPVYRHLRKLNAIRKAFAPLQKGPQKKLLGSRDAYAFRRDFAGETALVFLNKGGAPARLTAGGVPDGTYTELYTGARVTVAGGAAGIDVPAHGLRVLALGKVSGTPWQVPDWTGATGLRGTSPKAKAS
ncbi:MAG: hypothetical protein FJZ01_10870 [Candidatus Sericytochromatia bacterium]|nr:hypothetical protein [Candidatus Tanganyikabacteria bacterium]